MAKNYFDILGIGQEATQAEIKEAYKRMAMRYHPDKNSDPGAEERFKEINEAYKMLGDFYQRLLYEKELNSPVEEMATEPEITPEPPKPKKDHQTPSEPIKKPDSNTWWHKGLVILVTPIIILALVGLGKLIFGEGEKDNTEPQPLVEKKVENLPNRKKTIALQLWDLKKIWSSEPVTCILAIDSLRDLGKSTSETDSIRKLALGRLLAKSAYYFQTSDCQKGSQALELAKINDVALTKHQQKELDFYQFRCARESGDYTLALGLLELMEKNYQHQFSIVFAKAQLYHHQLKKPEMAIPLYKEARYLYAPQKIDAQFVPHWQSEQEEFAFGKLLSEYAQAYLAINNTKMGLRIALESTKADSSQILAYELIGNQLKKEKKSWGACKYWNIAAQNGSAAATDSLLRYCK